MIEEPVEYPSCRVMKSNSRVFQRMISSAKRDRLIAMSEATKANSATTSRLAVASIEFSAGPDSPSSLATSCGSRPSELPAKAPEP